MTTKLAYFILSSALLFSGCIKEGDDVKLSLDFGSNLISLSELKRMPIDTPIEEPLRILATVVSDPLAANTPTGFIFIQDNSSQGLCVFLDNASAFGFGEMISIEIKGSKLNLNADGVTTLFNVEQTKIVSEGSNSNLKPAKIKVGDMPLYESMYVAIETQATNADSGKPFEGKHQFETNYGRLLPVYTYTSATFKAEAIPSEYGFMEGIVSSVNNKRVLLPVNSSSYATMTNSRISPPTPVFSVSELRDMDPGVISTKINVTAVVCSSNADLNFPSTVAYIQDIERGIKLEFGEDHNLAFGQNITLNLNGCTFDAGDASNPAKLTGVMADNITTEGNPQSVEPKIVTIEQLTANNAYESMYVRINSIQAIQSQTYTKFLGDITFENANNQNIKIYTSSSSKRKNKTVPPASGAVCGVATKCGENPILTPSVNGDFIIPGNGTRLDNTNVLFFVGDDTKDIMISEVVHGVAADGAQVTAIELYNPTTKEIDLSSYMAVMIFHHSNTDIINGVGRQEFTNAADFPRKLKSGETLVIISDLALTGTGNKFNKDTYSYYFATAASEANLLGSKGNSPFVLLRNEGTTDTPVWTEIDRVGTPNILDEAALKPGETEIDNYSGAYKANPAAQSKLARGWNRGKTWVRNAGQSGAPGAVNTFNIATLAYSSSWKIEQKRNQYKEDIANTNSDPRLGGWAKISENSATSATSAKLNTTLGWHEWSVPLLQ